MKHQDLYVRGTSILKGRSYVVIADEIRIRYDCAIKITYFLNNFCSFIYNNIIKITGG